MNDPETTLSRARAEQRGLLAITAFGIAGICLVGRGAPPIAFIILVSATFGAFARLIVSLAKGRAIGTRALIVTTIVLIVFAVAVPPRSSRDIWGYVMFGRIVSVHHASPYTHVPADYQDDPLFPRVQPQFRTLESPYGPLFTAVSAGGTATCGRSALCDRLFFQLLEALAVVAITLVTWRTSRSVAATAFVGLNPILIASVVNGAHVDGLLALVILGAVVLARDRPVAAGLLMGAAVLIKFNALIVAAVVLMWLLARVGRIPAAKAGATTVLLAAAGYLAAGGMRALRPLQVQALEISNHSFWGSIERRVERALTSDGWSSARATDYSTHLISRVALVVVLVVVVAFALERLREKSLGPVVAIALAAYVLASPYILPWYTATLLPLLATRVLSRATWALMSYSALLFLVYPSHTRAGFAGSILPVAARNVLPIVELVILAILAIWLWRARTHVRIVNREHA